MAMVLTLPAYIELAPNPFDQLDGPYPLLESITSNNITFNHKMKSKPMDSNKVQRK